MIATPFELGNFTEYVDILDSQRVPVNSSDRQNRKGNIPYYGATGQVDWIDDYLFDEELVLLGEDGAPFLDTYKDKAYLISGKSWINNHAHVLRARNGLTNKFLLHWLNTVDYRPYIGGTTRDKLNQSRMREIPIPIVPTKQQERIVDNIEIQFTRLDAAIKNLKTIKNRLDIYRKSVLKAVFDGRFMDKFEYVTKQLGDFERKGGGTPSTKVKEYWGGKINWITSASIDDRGNISYEKKITELGLKNSATNLVPKGSVIIVTRVGLGKVAVNEEATAFSQDSQGIICENINPYFLMWQIKSSANEIISKGQGTTISGITVNKLNEIKVKIPDTKTQTEMVKQIESRFSVIDKLREVVDVSLAKTETLHKAILKSAFEGKLVN